jgi:ligand-binding SRPBCC domain-containing protein
MSFYQLYAKQALPISKAKAWDFLSDPKNLSAITPDSMGFEILSGASLPMFKGQIIQYKVSPFPGIKTRWVTEITHLKPGDYFVDEQRFGPYALWHHKHFLKSHEDGVIMEDLIDYKLPAGFVGVAMHAAYIRKKLLGVFTFRQIKLTDLFGAISETPSILEIKKV